jgi:septal ring factor EnvC (AmiA/AmiB activator)
MPRSRRGRFGRGRSIGVAEHRTNTGLTRSPSATFVAALFSALALVLTLVPTAAFAQSTDDRVAATRSSIDDAADRWFGAQQDAAELDAEIAALEQRVADLQTKVASVQKTATARALLIYKNASSSVPISGVVGNSAMDSARGAELMDHANGESLRAIDALNAATEDLAAKRDEMDARRDEHDAVLAEVASERSALDEQLAALRAQAGREEARATNANARAKSPRPTAPAIRPISARTSAPAPSAAIVVAPAGGGVSAHHDHPFLVCTRARESNGNYGAVSPAGYYGAYQFAPTTWNATASHAGRLDLVGVLPSRAAAYDQDEMAWVLYQWQGKGPWGGRC